MEHCIRLESSSVSKISNPEPFLSQIIVSKIDTVYARIETDASTAMELREYFTFDVPGARFTPAFRNKVWDGKIRLFSPYDQRLYVGLLAYVEEFASVRDYQVLYNDPHPAPKREVDIRTVKRYMQEGLRPHSKGQPLVLHDHQYDGVHHALTHGRATLLSPTSSGKSLMLYTLVRYYLSSIPKNQKVLLIVPTTGLVAQMYGDFKDYSSEDIRWNVDDEVHVIFEGQDKNSHQRVYISTWQSIYKQPKSYFKQFGAVLGDECHQFKAKSLTDIMVSLTDCPNRIGCTGTLDGTKTHKLVIEGLFGPTYQVTTSRDLMDQGIISPLKIDCITLRYNDDERKMVSALKYQGEIDWLISCQKRNEFLRDLSLRLKGNTLVLCNYVEKHLIPLHAMIEEEAKKGRKVFIVHGKTEIKDREAVREIVEKEDDAIICASYGTFSTGINIRRLHNIVFASPSKARIRVIQSIGRALRKSEYKCQARLYDVSDNLCWKSRSNFTYLHMQERLRMYLSEQFEHRIVSIRLV